MFTALAISTSNTTSYTSATAALKAVGWAAASYASVYLGVLTLQSDVDQTAKAQRIAERVAAINASRIAYDDNNFNNFHYVTYTKTSLNGFVYVGRSSGYGDPNSIVKARDYNHHKGSNFGNTVLSTSSRATIPGGYVMRINDPAYWYIRGAEQSQIEYYKSLGISGNSINGISFKNKNIWKYLENFLNY